ncbi:MAG: hypothetical protein WCY25_09910 [Moheibacter sp.]
MKNTGLTVRLCVFFLFCHLGVCAQIKPVQDSLAVTDTVRKDNDAFLETLEDYKNRNKFNRLVHKLFFRNPKTKKGRATSDRFGESQKSFREAEGKIIRHIEIETYDPFGHSLRDSTEVPHSFLEKAGNALHIKTKKFVVRNYLLLQEGDTLDSLKILESERLVRSQRFIRRVQIQTVPLGEGSDSVDLLIRTLDSWSIVPNLTYSGSKVGIRLRDRNFMGWGHDFDNRYRQNFETGKYRFQTRYTIPNIQRTFISFNLGYYSDEENGYTKGVSVQRKFFSPLTRWAGGAYVGQRAYQDSIPNEKQIFAQNIKYNLQDYWGGYAFRLFPGTHTNASRLNNLIVSARYFRVDYVESPTLLVDPIDFYSDEEFYLMGIGISQRSFVQDKFIRNYDIVEDIPVGMSYGITTGFQNKRERSRFYLAGGFKMGNYYRLGYFGFEAQYGGFLVGSKTEQSVFSIKTNYYTRLMSWGRWKFRNFISSNLIVGNNRVNSRGDRLTLNEQDPLGIEGFHSLEVIGTNKWLTNIQVQSYSPYEVLGFRLSPFLSSSLGLISNEGENLIDGKMYAKIGLGVMFTNDYLIFNNFQLSFAWYNTIPGHGDNIFKTNTFDSHDYELMDFDFGKPELIQYNPYVVY